MTASAASRPASYSVHPTPIGEALVIVTDEGLALLDVLEVRVGAVDDALSAATEHLRTVPRLDPGATATVTRQLDDYFAGSRREFDLALDLRGIGGFVRAALEAVCSIPYGEVASYAEVAILAGSPGANRAVGTACARTPVSIVIPAHRVVRSDGSIGEYGGHPERKRFLLDLEARISGLKAQPVRDSAGV
ncbi:methylated-DNA--[protein]-cysteine S-methyltransferase [Microbacterium dextranolyticum]|uniref:methylated-DNA--[protein]-cysteine S-methyltransferase n=1 Tax=Microbacterium dextranolyticum TaxID=36806 RepID=UPI001957FECC|nr:methylated-DNA--[protein]-cysteine S-methyltransferase [Microbacterium dextranolyticum]MBM7463487.1 methylated-DNA-[protein]-cysteine S-methyltransferase [Microbacterium dextranolyticum]